MVVVMHGQGNNLQKVGAYGYPIIWFLWNHFMAKQASINLPSNRVRSISFLWSYRHRDLTGEYVQKGEGGTSPPKIRL